MNLADALVLKRENLFLVAPPDGRLPGRDGYGLWYRDCRFLSALEPGADWEIPGPRRAVARVPLRGPAEVRLEADFEPMLAVRGLAPPYERPPVETSFDGRVLRFAVRGRDGVLRTTTAEPAEPPVAAEGGTLRFEPPAGGVLELAIEVSEDGDSARPRRREPPERARVTSDHEPLDRVLARSFGDLELLRSELDGRSYFAAGIPWFATLFGRDSLITAMQALAFMPEVAGDTVRLLGGLLGRELSDERDEEPGKVLHELRVGELAALGETPFARYYGSADSTPLWLVLLAEHARWSGDLGPFRELRPQVDAALEWFERYGDADGDGLVEYRRRSPHGLENQGWKDSPAGVPDAAGRPLAAPVALVEVQGYVARALRGVAALVERDGGRAERLRSRAAEVEASLERFREAGGYAIGLDRDKRPGSPLTSNQGHLLWAGALPGERAAAVRDLLMSGPLFSGWGFRTLAAGRPGYDPLGYHVGPVWPHDTAMIAGGLRRYGFDADFLTVFDALLEAAAHFPGGQLPELFGGLPRVDGEPPAPYPVACRPQAWAAGSIPYLLWTGLGLDPDGFERRLRVLRPLLPSGVTRLDLEGLRVAGARVDLRFERSGGEVAVTEARVDGELDLVVEPRPG